MKNKINAIIITEQDTNWMKEIFIEWFICPKCKSNFIAKWFKFCPNCGIKIKWKLNHANCT